MLAFMSRRGWPPSETIAALRRCVSLRHIVYQLPHDELDPETANALMELQWAVPRVRWYLSGAPRDCFDKTRKFCTKDYVGECTCWLCHDIVTRCRQSVNVHAGYVITTLLVKSAFTCRGRGASINLLNAISSALSHCAGFKDAMTCLGHAPAVDSMAVRTSSLVYI